MLVAALTGFLLAPEFGFSGPRAELKLGDRVALSSPQEGLWSVATAWEDGWPARWQHAHPTSITQSGDWQIASGTLTLPEGKLELRDAYRIEGDLVRCVRRWEWLGATPLNQVTLSVRWQMTDGQGAKPFLPGISYFGNPSGAKTNSCVPIQTMTPGEESFYEEHRYAMPFASLETPQHGAALHSIPSMPAGAHKADQWWTLGLTTREAGHELTLLSGPCASNGQRNVVKARQGTFMAYPDTWLTLKPGMILEKTFFLQAYPVEQAGFGFRHPMDASLNLFQPYSLDGLPTADEIVRSKLAFANSRWREGETPGFEMYPDYVQGTHYVMGWCGQAEALGYALQVLDPQSVPKVQGALDLLATSPFNARGFHQRYTVETGAWTEQDFVSQGQAMESFSRAVVRGAADGRDVGKWQDFLKRACDFHADRILKEDWRPVSTNEGFMVSPLLRASDIFKNDTYRRAALKAADHYAARHLSMAEPYWGGTLDAQCEDKEGAWAALQAFMAAYDATGEAKYLDYATHALYVTLSYTMVWDVDLPPGRLKDHGFKSRGWTVVSAQNQHLDVFGVYFTPEIYRMGELLGREDLKRLAKVMFRSCGQLIDANGSQGEQIQHTNFAQAGDMSDVYRLRGGYSEGWTVFWITTHFLHAAARFREMGVDLDGE